MTADVLEAKAHELIGQLGPGKLAAVVQLLEVMIHDEDEESLTPEDIASLQAGISSLEAGRWVPMEDVLADFGLTMDDFQKTSETPLHKDVA